MESALFLAGWASTGVASAAYCATKGESKWAWAPMAMILGPLFHSVAREQHEASPTATLSQEDGAIDLTAMPAEVRWIHEDHRLIP